jgi:hypothetical protein
MKKIKYVYLCFGIIWLSIILYGVFHPSADTSYNHHISDYAIRWNIALPEHVTQVYQHNTPSDLSRDTSSFTVYTIHDEAEIGSAFKNEKSEAMEKNFSDEMKGWNQLSEIDAAYYPDFKKNYSYMYISKYEHTEDFFAVYIKEDAKLYVFENI